MKPSQFNLIMAVMFLIFVLAILPGCSHSIIVKDCGETSKDTKRICQTLKLWE